MKRYKRLDVLIYNSGAIWWASVEKTPMKRFQLMQRVNPEGLYGCVQACLPRFAENGWQGRIVVVCPPIYERFFRGKTAYAMGKVGMSVLVKGLVRRILESEQHDQLIELLPRTTSPSYLVFLTILLNPPLPQAMDFNREGKTAMAVTGIWPDSLSPVPPPPPPAPHHTPS